MRIRLCCYGFSRALLSPGIGSCRKKKKENEQEGERPESVEYRDPSHNRFAREP
jgi:hypothetical protein